MAEGILEHEQQFRQQPGDNAEKSNTNGIDWNN